MFPVVELLDVVMFAFQTWDHKFYEEFLTKHVNKIVNAYFLPFIKTFLC